MAQGDAGTEGPRLDIVWVSGVLYSLLLLRQTGQAGDVRYRPTRITQIRELPPSEALRVHKHYDPPLHWKPGSFPRQKITLCNDEEWKISHPVGALRTPGELVVPNDSTVSWYFVRVYLHLVHFHFATSALCWLVKKLAHLVFFSIRST